MRADALEQVFLERQGGVYRLLLVLESPAGARERVSLTTNARDEAGALHFLLNYLRQQGHGLAGRVRVRRTQGGSLVDAPELVERLLAAHGGGRATGGRGKRRER